jgi:transposase
VLVELSVMEQRYQAVLAVVQDGWQVSEVARCVGVSRQSIHARIVRVTGEGSASKRGVQPSARARPLRRFACVEIVRKGRQ